MTEENKTHQAPKPAPSDNTKGSTPHAHPTHEWLSGWHQMVFPLRNGATLREYKPRIEKYIKAWVELINDVDPNGRKFKLRDFDFVPIGISTAQFKVVGNPELISNTPVGTANPQVLKKTEGSGGGGLPGEKPAGQHLIPPPPPPPR